MSDISVQVTVPDGLPVPRTTLMIETETAEQFEAYLEALGGITSVEYFHSDSLSVPLDGGARAYLHFPKDLVPPAPVQTPQTAFTAKLKQRQREALDLMDKLETAAGAGRAS